MGGGLSRVAQLGRVSGLYGLLCLPAGRRKRAIHLWLYPDERRYLGTRDYEGQRAGPASGDPGLYHDRRSRVFDVYPGKAYAAVVCTRYLYGRMRDVCRAGGLGAGASLANAGVGVWLCHEEQRPLAGRQTG